MEQVEKELDLELGGLGARVALPQIPRQARSGCFPHYQQLNIAGFAGVPVPVPFCLVLTQLPFSLATVAGRAALGGKGAPCWLLLGFPSLLHTRLQK